MAKSFHKNRRTTAELGVVASTFWSPDLLSDLETKLRIIPLLVRTQDQFIAVMGAGARTLRGLFTIIEGATLPANLFLKHLSIVADHSGEMLQKANCSFENLFPDGTLNYFWDGTLQQYTFLSLPKRKLSNKDLGIDSSAILKDDLLTDLQKDAIVLLLFGGSYCASNDKNLIALSKCNVGDFIGKSVALEQYIKQRYLWTARLN